MSYEPSYYNIVRVCRWPPHPAGSPCWDVRNQGGAEALDKRAQLQLCTLQAAWNPRAPPSSSHTPLCYRPIHRRSEYHGGARWPIWCDVGNFQRLRSHPGILMSWSTSTNKSLVCIVWLYYGLYYVTAILVSVFLAYAKVHIRQKQNVEKLQWLQEKLRHRTLQLPFATSK